ncbi:hypothetical protein NWE74_16875 [Romboutsia lituseburensis]|nr:hypothetical protein [Romboutsia lituseburensis]MCR8746847.1 hypothetical protein [Romboutsia lituseburensis]
MLKFLKKIALSKISRIFKTKRAELLADIFSKSIIELAALSSALSEILLNGMLFIYAT